MKRAFFFSFLSFVALVAIAQTPQSTPTISPTFDRQTLQEVTQKKDTVVLTPASQQAAATQQPAHSTTPLSQRFFYGGNFGFDFSTDYWQLQIAPLVGFKVTDYLSVGLQIAYEYSSYSGIPEYSAQGFGGGLFSRYDLPIPALKRLGSDIFIHAEYDFMHYSTSYKNDTPTISSNRSELMLGAGVYIPVGARARFYIAALWDVLHLDEYNAATPTLRIGMMF